MAGHARRLSLIHICAATYGTAHASFKGVAYSVAGKTGTAQVFTIAQNAKYDEKTVEERLRDHAWFIACLLYTSRCV